MRVRLSPARALALGAIIAAPLGLGACDTMQGALGIGKLPPDEYAVAPRRPLAMPPDITLRPPQPGAASPADISASGVAANAMATSGDGSTAVPASAEPPVALPPPSTPPATTESDTTSTSSDGSGRTLDTGR